MRNAQVDHAQVVLVFTGMSRKQIKMRGTPLNNQDCKHGTEILHPGGDCGTDERGVGGVGLGQIPLDVIRLYSDPFNA